jgi:hypothetical protein
MGLTPITAAPIIGTTTGAIAGDKKPGSIASGFFFYSVAKK